MGAAGGLLGSQIGHGDGRTAATAAGAVAGFLLGSGM
ncbi:MAG: glycine zipper 2TM domain-containing protein [Gammaproteobacteria bacterium]|nr:glycine zipper 2TM domain-containing protein [Gammaproteobacteria bacterium]MBI5617542.1 glycine zipper 2TM domain-containing protein [Gammaproteobacteria bacterium]